MSKMQLFRLSAAILGFIGVALQIITDGWGMLLYYTTLSNILVFCFMLYLVFHEGKHGPIWQEARLIRTKGGVTMAITITFMVYHFLLSPYVDHDAYWNVRNFLVHYIAPLCLIFDTLFFDHRKSYRWTDPVSWTLVPLAYFAFAIFNGLVTKIPIPGSPDSPYAYYFINISKFSKYGISGVLINSFFISMSYVLFGFMLLFLKQFIGRQKTVEK